MPLRMAAIPRICRFAAAAMLLAAATLAQAQVARVIETRGAAMVERTGQAPRLLGIGEGLDRRDTIRVARASWAVLEFTDRTRITLRPDTVFRIDAYSDNAPESVLMGLVKGGFRAVTGLIGKRNPRAVVFGTPYATIGIRGTEFDARLCDGDCAAEEMRPAPSAGPAARVTNVRGTASAHDLWGRTRTLVPGSIVDAAEEIRTGPGATAVLELRDGGRLALGPRTRFEIRRFVYDPARPAAAIAEFELRAGSIRAATGAIGKARPVGYRIFTKLGQIGTRGTELVVSCTANCETPPEAPPKPPASNPPALGNVGEIRLPNGIVLETRLKPDGTLGFFERVPRGEPIGTLPDGSPLYANPAPPNDGNLEWVYAGGAFVNLGGEANQAVGRVPVGALVASNGVMHVLSESPWLANETGSSGSDGSRSRTLQAVSEDGRVLPDSQRAPALDGSTTLADGGRMAVGAGSVEDLMQQMRSEREAALQSAPPSPAPTPTTPPQPQSLDNLREVRLPNGVVLEARRKSDGTLGFFEKLPPRGEPIAVLAWGTPLYADPAPLTDGNLEWRFDQARGGFVNVRPTPEPSGAGVTFDWRWDETRGQFVHVDWRPEEIVAVGAVVMQDGVMRVLAEAPFQAGEANRGPESPASRLPDSTTLAGGGQLAVGPSEALQLISQVREATAAALENSPPSTPPPAPASSPPADPQARNAGNTDIGEVRLPNGVVLETRLKPDGTMGFFERLPPRGEPIGILPDGTPLYAQPAPPTDGNLEWRFDAANGRFENLTAAGELGGISERIAVAAVVTRDGVMHVLSEPPFRENEVRVERGESGSTRSLQTVSADGPVLTDAQRPAPLDGTTTLADGSRMAVGGGSSGAVAAIEQFRIERGAQLAAEQSMPPGDLRVTTSEGTAVLETTGGQADVTAGQTGTVGTDGNVATVATPSGPGVRFEWRWDETRGEFVHVDWTPEESVAVGAGASIPAAPPPSPPAPTEEPAAVETGLYTWVRDGAITLQKDGTTIEVPAGSAALASQTTLRILVSVPDFLRLDPTPLPDPDSLKRVSIFTAPDGSTFGSCRVQ
ncbi:MAG: FecR domain-containing protein [Burkholderiales bacterium]